MSTQQAEPEETPRGGQIATPAMARYLELKAENPGYLLFYRMGDFYELFFEDAEKAAAALDIALTKRGKHRGEDIKMCGVPVHSADSYLQRLIAQGFKVAVCEQLEDPAEARQRRGAKAPIARDVVRLVTPGTLTEDSLLEARANNFLVAVAGAGRPSDAASPQLALGWLDISTGDFAAAATTTTTLAADLARLAPAEILVSERLIELPELGGIIALQTATISVQPQTRFDSGAGEARLHAFFGVSALDGFGNFSRAEIAALGALIAYIDETQKGRLPAIKPPRAEGGNALLALDPSTRANLELMQSLSGERKGSLLAAIDRTVTNGGARLLAGRLASPSADIATINSRLDAVGALVQSQHLRTALRARLRTTPDLARALGRLALGRGGPRDLSHVRDALSAAAEIGVLLSDNEEPAVFDAAETKAGELAVAAERLHPPGEVTELRRELERALGPELPLLARDGGFVRLGFDAKLDETRALRDQSRTVLARLEGKYREHSGVTSLKIKHNNVLGYFIEVTAANQSRMMAPPLSETFIHRQTLAGAYRFTTVELNDLASRILDAGAKALTLELEIFERLVSLVVANSSAVHQIAEALAIVDVTQGFATLAVDADYVRPCIRDDLAFAIKGGRHPVVELAMRGQSDNNAFIGNDCDLSGEENNAARILLVTGPNMAGKSTYLRQNALIAILAQTGSFVPAKSAEIGIVDRIFSRVGASDDLARGRSTFMVEMIETAAILNQATARSLVILDEIGRGTATYDGLAIAWAALEHLHEENKSRALFATHYHELTVLKERLKALKPVTMRVSEWKGDIVFLHEVVPGAADRSYGIQVAKLAGVPAAVTTRADAILSELEQQGEAKSLKLKIDDLPLFRAARAPARKQSELSQMLTTLDLDLLSPREALETLYRLKAAAQKESQ